MKRIITTSDANITTDVNQFPNDFKIDLISEKRYELNHEALKTTIYEIIFNGLHITYADVSLDTEFKLDVDYDFPLLKMQFELEGYSSFVPKNKKDLNILIKGGNHQLFYLPNVNGTLTYNTNRKVFEIMFSKEFFHKVFGNDLDVLGVFGKAINNNKSAILGDDSLPIHAEMKHIIQTILFCKFTGKLKEIYLETKIIELLIMQVQQFQNQKEYSNQTNLKPDDIDKLYYAKQLLEEHIQKSISIDQLSKMVGLNTFKLKTGFKSLFDSTIYNYLITTRMNYAKKLIQTGQNTISETAYLVGYKNPQHFTTAFKKTFGYLPSELRKNVLPPLNN